MSLRDALGPRYDKSQEHILVDFDSTLVTYESWSGPMYVGHPIVPMVDRVRAWLAAGKRVKVFTARVAHDNQELVRQQRELIQRWCTEHLGQVLEVTCVKDCHAIELWDDRAVHVVPNTGEVPHVPKGFGGQP